MSSHAHSLTLHLIYSSDIETRKYLAATSKKCRSTESCWASLGYPHSSENAIIVRKSPYLLNFSFNIHTEIHSSTLFFRKYFHGLYDTLNMVRSAKSKWNPRFSVVSFQIDINEVVTSNRSKMFGIEKRKCRFDEETISNRSYPLGSYTQNLCLMECSVDAAINLCGCRPFFYKIGFI